MNKTLSALIMAHNEEAILESCLEKLIFCDEIVVILDKSTDNSKKIAQNFSKKIFEGSWEYEGDRRNFGIKKCTSDWIIEVDADEHISKKLADEIIKTINLEDKYNNYHIKIHNYIGSKLVKYGWGGTIGRGGVTCLFKKGTKTWGKQRVHPKIKFIGKFGPTLQNQIDHYFVKDISSLFSKFNNWTYLKSLDIIEDKNSNEKLSKNIRRIISRFLKNYYKRKGYREGKVGFLLALFSGLFPIFSYLRAEISKQKNL